MIKLQKISGNCKLKTDPKKEWEAVLEAHGAYQTTAGCGPMDTKEEYLRVSREHKNKETR